MAERVDVMTAARVESGVGGSIPIAGGGMASSPARGRGNMGGGIRDRRVWTRVISAPKSRQIEVLGRPGSNLGDL